MEGQAASASESTGSPPRPRVLYVMGAGRSGSTILGVTLGNCENVFYAGELDAWLARSGDPQLAGDERERFWGEVRDRVPDASALFGREPQRSVERSMALVRVHKWPARRRLRGPYRRIAESLYTAIAQAAGTSLIVDTSHYPLRALELQALRGVDLHLLYLMRDPQSVVASFNRKDVAQYRKSTLTTNVYLWLTNLLAVGVFLRHPPERRLFVRYEEFIAHPDRVLADILDQVGGSALPPDLSQLRTGIPFQGNRLIRSEVIALESAPSRAASRSLLTAAMQLPWNALLSRLRPVAGKVAAREEGHAVAQ
jgi:hypothetical protein